RLEAVGIRAINNVVDVTNYVMMELGQPLHAFDLTELEGHQIIVRRAQDGEVFTTLDNLERHLESTDLMIADQRRSVAIAGVMGGLNSEVSEISTDILLESACFAPASIRKTSKKLGLSTEASYRFERGVDPLGTVTALKRATKLIAELTGGRVAQGVIDVFPRPYTPQRIDLRPSRVEEILGVAIDEKTMQQILTSLGCAVHYQHMQAFQVEIPSYRPDIEREIDLVEEIGRIYGYDKIPTALPSGEIPPKIANSRRQVEDLVRNVLVSQGLHEVINYSFFDENSLEKLSVNTIPPYNQLVSLKNPLTVEHGVLRTTTIPGLLNTVRLNRRNETENIRIFEIGKIFIASEMSGHLPDEKITVSGILAGAREEMGWAQTPEPVDFYDVKGIIENLLTTLRISYTFRPTDTVTFLHPGESATIQTQEDDNVGFIGRMHPTVLEAFDIDDDNIYLFELSVESLAAQTAFSSTFSSLPKFPAVYRDLAVIVPAASVQASDIHTVIREAGAPLLEHVTLFDRYVGQQIADGCISYTYSLRYRSPEKTLTDSEVAEIHQRIIDQLQTRLGITLR
ncbi:phenylalanine--tRNA ligase subunit beta, partial [candidate division KSB3 bacterium]|nr:phenylalanine--tRNA ligase subunit beta [candidate division KSB3 bacterium]MBD3326827.1 phenylalanine--tRNA ligase subunit beta [candidate division KSB3 bacterium]